MKRFLAVILAATLVSSIAVPAMAEEDTSPKTITGSSGSAGFDVNADISKETGTTDGKTVYSAKVEWSMKPAVYEDSSGKVYQLNSDKSSYTEVSDPSKISRDSQTNAYVTISLSNSSNAAIQYAKTFTSEKDGTKAVSTETPGDWVPDLAGSSDWPSVIDWPASTLPSAEPVKAQYDTDGKTIIGVEKDLGLEDGHASGNQGHVRKATYTAEVLFDTYAKQTSSVAEKTHLGIYTLVLSK